MFTIYFHKDFDGLSSAAIFSKFLYLEKGLEFTEIQFEPVDYNLRNDWIEMELQSPNAILDFMYHPKADWWFDHHESTFLNLEALSKPYKKSAKQFWSTKFDSCPSLILTHFYNYFRKSAIKLRKEYKELAHWTDVIDGANYTSPKEIFSYSSLYINIDKTLSYSTESNYLEFLIKNLYHNDIDSIKKNRLFSKFVKKSKNDFKKSVEIVENIISIKNKVAFYDQTSFDIPFQRYLTYYLYPDVLYRIVVYQKSEKFSISLNFNNWADFNNEIHIGDFCRKLGGGGRKNVGAILEDDYDIAIKKAKTLFKWFSRYPKEQLEIL